jgi:hypothetical protein
VAFSRAGRGADFARAVASAVNVPPAPFPQPLVQLPPSDSSRAANAGDLGWHRGSMDFIVIGIVIYRYLLVTSILLIGSCVWYVVWTNLQKREEVIVIFGSMMQFFF